MQLRDLLLFNKISYVIGGLIMPNNESDNLEDRSYSQRHPVRMASGMLMLGATLGASLMAAKKKQEKSSLQKFLDQLSDRVG
jgi:hypothetical protein